MRIHPYAKLLPMMTADEFAALKDDIKTHGLLEPIWLFKGEVIDGRNRLRACNELGIKPKFREWKSNGASLLAFITSLNVHRRHLSASQRAAYAVNILPVLQKESRQRQLAGLKRGQQGSVRAKIPERTAEDGRARDAAGKLFNTSGRYVEDAALIKKHSPKMFQQVLAGEKTISEARLHLKQTTAQKLLDTSQSENGKGWTVTANQAVVPCDAVITDPPYGILDEQWEPKNLRKFTTNWAQRWNDSGAKYFLAFFSQKHIPLGQEIFDTSLKDFEFVQLLIWHYANNIHCHSPYEFKGSWQPIFFYRRKGFKRALFESAPTFKDAITSLDCCVTAVPKAAYLGVDEKVHTAQKPLLVMKWLVSAATVAGELVVDPFCGSGTTGVACSQLGRRFHGIEINARYRKWARGRIQKFGKG